MGPRGLLPRHTACLMPHSRLGHGCIPQYLNKIDMRNGTCDHCQHTLTYRHQILLTCPRWQTPPIPLNLTVQKLLFDGSHFDLLVQLAKVGIGHPTPINMIGQQLVI